MKVYDKIAQFALIVCVIPYSSTKPSSLKNDTEKIEITTDKEETTPTLITQEKSPFSTQDSTTPISSEHLLTTSKENVSTTTEEYAYTSSEQFAYSYSEENVTSSSEENASNSSEDNESNSSEENASNSSEDNESNSSEENESNSSEENASNSSEENGPNSSEENGPNSSEDNGPNSSEDNESNSSEENASMLIDVPNNGLFSEEYPYIFSDRNTSADTPSETNENAAIENFNDHDNDYDFDSRGENEGQSENETNINANGTLIPIDPDLLAFYLYPRKDNNSYCEEIIYGDRSSLERSSFNSSNPVVFIIHGFISNYTTKFTQSVKNAYLQYGIVDKENVIAVDWGKLATSNNYTHTEGTVPSSRDLAHDMYYQAAVGNVPIAGKRIAEFISFLSGEGYISGPADAHLIGFSLGAHVGGATGMTFRQQNLTLIKRITGADPAGPIYQKERDPDKMLDPSDATFVDVIHTNQGQDGYYGNEGHADFMINGGGPNQPGCQNVAGSTIPDNMSGICAHNKSWQLYIRSLVETIYGCKCPMGNGAPDFALCRTLCPQKVVFGHRCPPSARGSYYVETN